jgi:hypothetical protein
VKATMVGDDLATVFVLIGVAVTFL